MKLTRGDVVLVDYPYTDRTGSKVRPTAVVSADELNQTDDVVLAAITSVVRPKLDAWQLQINPARPDSRGTGLLATSVIDCGNVLTVDQGFVLKKLGRLPRSIMTQVDNCLAKALGVKP
ncbi:MAG: type II toxin-antitoxin system PemK/MazF family toxin [Pirellulales bacterium]|nr:type II toxin-antitoxin system PemK/MazF family toxin [Pirellulales bacterium]